MPPLLSCPIDVKTIYQFGTSSFLFGNTVVRWIINSFYSIKNGNFLILQPQCWERASKQYLKDGLMYMKVNTGITLICMPASKCTSSACTTGYSWWLRLRSLIVPGSMWVSHPNIFTYKTGQIYSWSPETLVLSKSKCIISCHNLL